MAPPPGVNNNNNNCGRTRKWWWPPSPSSTDPSQWAARTTASHPGTTTPSSARYHAQHTQLISLLLSCFFTDNMTVWTSWLYICTILLFIWRIPPPSIFLLFQYWIVQIFAYPIIAKYVKLISPRVFSFWASENIPALRFLYLQRWALALLFSRFRFDTKWQRNSAKSWNVAKCTVL